MKVTSLELLECLDYLRQREEDLLWEIDVSREIPPDFSMVEAAQEELMTVRNLKKLVQTAEEVYDEA
jgi:hypothetical protein